MPLPVVPLPRREVDLGDGVRVLVRSLTRVETLELGDLDATPEIADVFLLSRGTDTPEDEVRAWRESTGHLAADLLTVAISELSGLSEGAQKSNGAQADEG